MAESRATLACSVSATITRLAVLSLATSLAVAMGACSSEGKDADPSWWNQAGAAGAGNGGTSGNAGSSGVAGTGGANTGGDGGGSTGGGSTGGGSTGGGSTGGGSTGGSAGTGGGTAGSGGNVDDPYDADRNAVLARINELRAGKSLPPFTRWLEAEPCADLQAEDDSITGIPHNAWKTGKFGCPGGKSENECPGWGGPGCVDAMWGEGSLPDCANCDFCDGDHGCDGCDFYGSTTGTTCGHYENLSAQSYTRVAIGFGGQWMLINFD